jgi:hypothetical protein
VNAAESSTLLLSVSNSAQRARQHGVGRRVYTQRSISNSGPTRFSRAFSPGHNEVGAPSPNAGLPMLAICYGIY